MNGHRRRGYTLLEIMLVVAVIAIVAGLAIPYLEGAFSGNQLNVAADLVKSRVNEMRTRARDEGRAYKLTISDDNLSFRVEPMGDCAGDAGMVPATEDVLPKDIVFRGCVACSTDGQGSTSNVTEIVVLPDGTATSDYEIAFGPAEGRVMVVRLRGVTGAVTSGIGGEGGR